MSSVPLFLPPWLCIVWCIPCSSHSFQKLVILVRLCFNKQLDPSPTAFPQGLLRDKIGHHTLIPCHILKKITAITSSLKLIFLMATCFFGLPPLTIGGGGKKRLHLTTPRSTEKIWTNSSGFPSNAATARSALPTHKCANRYAYIHETT